MILERDLKLLTQVSNLDLEISHIISLSGINDIKIILIKIMKIF